MTLNLRGIAALCVVLLWGACVASPPARLDPGSALTSITADAMIRDVTALASDKFEGRKPGTLGDQLTTEYIRRRFTEIGLTPGSSDDKFVQPVRLVGITSTAGASVSIHGRRTVLRNPEDFVARSLLNEGSISIVDSPVVFVGYGIDSPEFGWNDYEGIDVKGKTVLVLPNEPSASVAGATDSGFFRGVEMTVHGTTRKKREVAFHKGAAAIIFLFGIESSVPFRAVARSFQTEALRIDDTEPTIAVQGALPPDGARRLVTAAGSDLDKLSQSARQRGFRAVSLNMLLSFEIVTQRRSVMSSNLIGKVVGSDPELRYEYLIFSAHWDGLGRDVSAVGDQIYNGAIDNAGGVSQLLAIASAIQKLPRPPKRTILFLATTAEESGLLGAHYYVTHPLYPLERTVAALNLDNFYPFGRTMDVVNFGDGRSSLDEVLREVVAGQGRRVVPDPFAAQGFYFRMDHFEFAEVGVPAISASLGVEIVGTPEGFGKQQVDEYLEKDYHQPSDEVRSGWDLSGAVEDAQMYLLMGLQISEVAQWPEWKPGAEFKARREAMLAEHR